MSSLRNKVLIVVDSFRREYSGAAALVLDLNSVGVDAKVCSKLDLNSAYNGYKPDIVLVPKNHKITALEQLHRQSAVCLLRSESFSGSKKALIDFSVNAPEFMKPQFVDKCYCWGQFDYDVYHDYKVFPAEKLLITGHPIVNSWYSKFPTKNSKAKPVIGLGMSLRSLTHSKRSENLIKMVYEIEMNGDSGFFDPPYHAENWLAFEAAWLRIVFKLIEEAREKGYDISIRPHPLESLDDYKFFQQFSHVSVDIQNDIVDWVDSIDCLVTFLSVTQLDAHVRGKPVVLLKNLFPKDVIKGVPERLQPPFSDYFSAPNNLEELFQVIRGGAKVDPAIDEFLKYNFNFKVERPSLLLAQDLKKMLRDEALFAKKEKFSALPETQLQKMVPNFSGKDWVVSSKRWVKSFLEGKSYGDFNPLRYAENKKVIQRVQQRMRLDGR